MLNTASAPLKDVQVMGTRLSGANGALIAVESNGGDVRDVLVSGLVADNTAPNPSSVRIRNLATASGGASLRNVNLRDITMTHPSANTVAIDVSSTAPGVSSRLGGVSLDNVRVLCSGTAGTPQPVLAIAATGTSRIEGVSWRSGGIQSAASAAFANRYLTVKNADDVVLSDLTFAGSTDGQPVTVGVGGTCTNVAFNDVLVSAASGAPVVTFDNARHCGWTRGAITGPASAASGGAAKFTADAVGCYLTGADLSGSGSDDATKIDVSAAPTTRLQDNFASTQLSAVTLGTAVSIVPTSGAIGSATPGYTLPASHLLVAGAGSSTLSTIYGGSAGFLLTLRSATSLTVNETGNLKLTASHTLAGPNDTLTLVYDGANWLEVAFSSNA